MRFVFSLMIMIICIELFCCVRCKSHFFVIIRTSFFKYIPYSTVHSSMAVIPLDSLEKLRFCFFPKSNGKDTQFFVPHLTEIVCCETLSITFEVYVWFLESFRTKMRVYKGLTLTGVCAEHFCLSHFKKYIFVCVSRRWSNYSFEFNKKRYMQTSISSPACIVKISAIIKRITTHGIHKFAHLVKL